MSNLSLPSPYKDMVSLGLEIKDNLEILNDICQELIS